MDPMTIATLAGSVFNAFKQNQQQRRAEDLQQVGINNQRVAGLRDQANLDKQYADKTKTYAELMKLALADKTDALGNKTSYEEGKGFVSKASPIIQAILNAQTREQYKNVTEDASTAREARARKDKRSRSASDLFDRAFAEVSGKYRRPESEYQAEGVLDSLDQRSGEGNPVSQALVAQALRSGDLSSVAKLMKAGAGKGSIRSTIRSGQDTGKARYAQEKQNRTAVDFGELEQLRGIANDTDTVNPGYNNTNETLASDSNAALQRLSQVIQGKPSQQFVGSSGGGVINPGPGVDYSAIFSSLGTALSKPKGDPELEALLRQAQISDAQTGIAQNSYNMRKYQGNSERI
jgi:hypothetical protein